MGGHGGLNILPQKKWNVYNYDNRAIVDKDKKQAAAKKKAQFQKDRQSKLEGKLEVLKQQNQQSGYSQKQKKEQSLINILNDEFKKLNEKTHINLFQREQQIIENRQIFQIKKLKEAQFLKDKNMDYSSKFLGTYAEGNKKAPWYARQKGYVQAKKKPAEVEQLMSVKKSDSHTISEVIKIEKKEHDKGRDRSRQRSREKKQNNQPKSQIDLLREKRIKRQQKQRQKAMRLKMLKTNI